MSVLTEQIKPETFALIERQAENSGLSIDDYLQGILLKRDLDFESDMSEFAEANESYHGTFSRADIYFDHD